MLRRVYEEVFNQGKVELIGDLVTADAKDHENGDHGPDGMKRTIATFRNAFPDIRMTVDDMIAEGDKVAARVTVTGTHQGEFMGIPATGKKINVQTIDILRFEGGKLAEHWGITDTGAMMEQLGVAPGQG